MPRPATATKVRKALRHKAPGAAAQAVATQAVVSSSKQQQADAVSWSARWEDQHTFESSCSATTFKSAINSSY